MRFSAAGASTDTSAFTACFNRHVDSVRVTAYLLCRDRHRAEDLTQAAFLKLYLAWSRLDEHEHLGAYLRKVVVREFLTDRRRAWWRRESGVDEPPESPAVEPDREDRVVLWDLISALPPRQRAVLVLRFWQDLDVNDTAAALGCTPGTVKSQTSKALAALRARLSVGRESYAR